MSGAAERFEFVCRAGTRLELLLELAAEPAQRATLEAHLDLPKATVARNLAELRERDLVVRREGRYAVTPTGTVVATGIDALCDASAATPIGSTPSPSSAGPGTG